MTFKIYLILRKDQGLVGKHPGTPWGLQQQRLDIAMRLESERNAQVASGLELWQKAKTELPRGLATACHS